MGWLVTTLSLFVMFCFVLKITDLISMGCLRFLKCFDEFFEYFLPTMRLDHLKNLPVGLPL